jgi:hypothetical protein
MCRNILGLTSPSIWAWQLLLPSIILEWPYIILDTLLKREVMKLGSGN